MTSATLDPATVWQLHPLVELHWRRWGDEWAVFDGGSGQTHQVDGLTAAALLLLEASPVSEEVLLDRIADELQVDATTALNAALCEVLERLSTAGLIEPA